MKFGKKYKKVLELVDIKKQYSIEEACELVKKTSITKFDATVDVSFSLGVDTTLADQQVRGTLTLPHGNGKKVKILALTNTKAEDAKAAGADYVGAKELLDKVVQQNWFDFDVIIRVISLYLIKFKKFMYVPIHGAIVDIQTSGNFSVLVPVETRWQMFVQSVYSSGRKCCC